MLMQALSSLYKGYICLVQLIRILKGVLQYTHFTRAHKCISIKKKITKKINPYKQVHVQN